MAAGARRPGGFVLDGRRSDPAAYARRYSSRSRAELRCEPSNDIEVAAVHSWNSSNASRQGSRFFSMRPRNLMFPGVLVFPFLLGKRLVRDRVMSIDVF